MFVFWSLMEKGLHKRCVLQDIYVIRIHHGDGGKCHQF